MFAVGFVYDFTAASYFALPLTLYLSFVPQSIFRQAWHRWLMLFAFVILEYGVAFFVLNFFAFRALAPKPRAIRLTATAWAAWSAIFAFRAETPFELLSLPLFFGVAGLPIGYVLYRVLQRRSSHKGAEWRSFE